MCKTHKYIRKSSERRRYKGKDGTTESRELKNQRMKKKCGKFKELAGSGIGSWKCCDRRRSRCTTLVHPCAVAMQYILIIHPIFPFLLVDFPSYNSAQLASVIFSPFLESRLRHGTFGSATTSIHILISRNVLGIHLGYLCINCFGLRCHWEMRKIRLLISRTRFASDLTSTWLKCKTSWRRKEIASLKLARTSFPNHLNRRLDAFKVGAGNHKFFGSSGARCGFPRFVVSFREKSIWATNLSSISHFTLLH